MEELFDDNIEIIPIFEEIISSAELMEDNDQRTELPILPLRSSVLFPHSIIPITVGRKASIKLVENAEKGSRVIGVVAQKKDTNEEPNSDEIFHIGTQARILKMLKDAKGNLTVIVQGQKRFKITEIITEKPYIQAVVEDLKQQEIPEESKEEFAIVVEKIRELALEIIKELPRVPAEIIEMVSKMKDINHLIEFVVGNIRLSVEERQYILGETNQMDRAMKTLEHMNKEYNRLKLLNSVQSKVRVDMDKQQRDYFLHQQIKTIQEELGGATHETDIEELKKQAQNKKWDAKTKEHFDKELQKLQRMSTHTAEYPTQRSYLDFFLALPWNDFSKDNFDLQKAQKILDKDHYGLEEVKRRIIEYLAVLKLRNDMKSPILCLYGPPGVGKTSLGRSIAKALNREYVRMSLGGLRDESEIRGHRKTYIGAMPGRVLQLLKKAKTSNPVFVLDEIDKLSVSHSGDPSSAMLEVLDPEQNNEFYDNYLEYDFDLSKVMFVATANDLSTIQPALLDRMEIINVSGYTIEEKVEIAKKYLITKQIKEHGMNPKDLILGKKEIEFIVEGYTRESGVRGLEKQIAKVVRSVAKSIAMEQEYEPKLTIEMLSEILGVPRFERDKYEDNAVAGVVTGLAWTSVGGDILFVESTLSKGKGNLTITGNLGNVMKESATIAMEYLKANSDLFDIDPKLFENYNFHIHVPEGATPKDGPSAGITMLTSLVSALKQKRVKKNLAMTGEITLRGKVLPVGGIKEKILAAKRAGIKEIILCKENQKDIQEIKQDYLKGLSFHYVQSMQEVIEIAVTNQDVKNRKER